ncbi:MAG TPA: IS3 family transposase [Treponemataceae bacterium]|nr:IS3 family transposase [Treponemataceae bacterium]
MPFVDTGEKMQAIIERYIDFYNNNRMQKKLGYRSPVEYRKLVA